MVLILSFTLLIYLMFTGIDYIKNHKYKLMGSQKKKDSVAKYIFGVIYMIISIIFILNIVDFKIWGYCIIVIIIILMFITIITRLLEKREVANFVLGIGITITLFYNLFYGIMFETAEKVEHEDNLSITSFNQRLIMYYGIKSGAEVRALLQQVISSNANEDNKDRIIAVEFGSYGEIITRENPTQFKSDWKNSNEILVEKKYSIEFQYSENDVINKIIIKEVNTIH